MNPNDPTVHTDPAMNVVADQSADGTFEIRVTRSTAPHAAHPPVAAPVGEGARHSVAPPAPSRTVLRYVLPVVLGVAGVTAAAFAVTREPATFVPPPIPDPQPAAGFEVFRIELAEPPPTLGRAALTFDAGYGDSPNAGSGAVAAPADVPVAADERALAPQTPDIGLDQAAPRGGEPPLQPLDEVTREQLRVLPVDAPVLADPALLNLGQNGGE